MALELTPKASSKSEGSPSLIYIIWADGSKLHAQFAQRISMASPNRFHF